MENRSTMFSSSECITWFALFLTESVAIVTVNLLSIIIFIKNSNLRTRAMYLVINLTVADIFVGGISSIFLFEILGYHCRIVTIGSNTTPEGNITLFVFRWFPLTSLTSIAVISLDRMHATFRPFRHRNIKKWVYWVTIGAIWVFAAVMSTAMTLVSLHSGRQEPLPLYLWLSYCCLCLLVICVSYTSIAVRYWCAARPQHHGAASRQRKLTVTLLIMTIVSLLFWLPYLIFTFVILTGRRSLSFQQMMRVRFILLLLFYTNSFVNPIIYTIRIPEFRKALIALFTCQKRQNAAIPLAAR